MTNYFTDSLQQKNKLKIFNFFKKDIDAIIFEPYNRPIQTRDGYGAAN